MPSSGWTGGATAVLREADRHFLWLQGQPLRAVSITPIHKRLSDARLAFGGIDGDSYADRRGVLSHPRLFYAYISKGIEKG